jgi:transposase
MEIDLRCQANYWRSRHAYAIERLNRCIQQVKQLKHVISERDIVINKQLQEIERLKATIVWFEQQMFGQKSERTREQLIDQEACSDGDSQGPSTDDRRRRGKQPGTKGNGRKLRHNLAFVEAIHELDRQKRRCDTCGKPYREIAGTEDCEQVEWEVRLYRIIHKRKRYVPDCNCKGGIGILTAEVVPKLIPKGMFTCGFWARLLIEKFQHQRPLCRIRQMLEMDGLSVSEGTLTGGLQRIGELLVPVYTAILARSRTASHWHMDETGWKVFVEQAGKRGFGWWLWVISTADTCVYILDPSRSRRVISDYLGSGAEGIVSSDRHSAYKNLPDGIYVSFCWTHVRRDFIKVRDGYKKLGLWANEWILAIKRLYGLNARRIELIGNADAFAEADRLLREAVANMAKVRDRQLASRDLHPAQRKVLKSLKNHWEGLTVFVQQPQIPMDNNEAERRLRNPVVGRKNYYGSGSVWSGKLAAMCFTIFQTLLKHGINCREFLLEYFEACAANGGRPPEHIEHYLPWNLSEEQRATWAHPQRSPPVPIT